MYVCFIQSQLRNHERERHSFSSDTAALTPDSETLTMLEEAERGTDEGKMCKIFVIRAFSPCCYSSLATCQCFQKSLFPQLQNVVRRCLSAMCVTTPALHMLE